MERASCKSDLRVIERAANELTIEGDLMEANAAEFERSVQTLNAERGCAIKLDLSQLDIDDGVAVVVAINSIRALAARSEKIIIKGAPQILGHNLYRVGLLEGDGTIELIDMRLDEAS